MMHNYLGRGKLLSAIAIGTLICSAATVQAGYKITQISSESTQIIGPAWISDNGDLAWNAYDTTDQEIYHYDDTTATISQVTDNDRYDVIREMNARGDLLIMSYLSPCPTTGCEFAYDLYEKSTNSLIRLTEPDVSFATWVDDGQLNDNGDFAVTVARWPNGRIKVSSDIDRTLTDVGGNSYTNYHPDMNNNGDVVWVARSNVDYLYYVFKYDNTTGITERLIPVNAWGGSQKINDSGDVLFSNTGGLYLYSTVDGSITGLSSVFTGYLGRHGYTSFNNTGYIIGYWGQYNSGTTRLYDTATDTFSEFLDVTGSFLNDKYLAMKSGSEINSFEIATGTISTVYSSATVSDPQINHDGDLVFTDNVGGTNQVFKAELLDNTIAVIKVTYDVGNLSVKATSSYGADAALEVEGFGSMNWNAKKDHWELKVRKLALVPATVTVTGLEGGVTVPVGIDE